MLLLLDLPVLLVCVCVYLVLSVRQTALCVNFVVVVAVVVVVVVVVVFFFVCLLVYFSPQLTMHIDEIVQNNLLMSSIASQSIHELTSLLTLGKVF